MARAAVGYINWLDQPGVTFTTTNEALEAPASNLAKPAAGEPWRVTDLSGSAGAFSVEIDLGRDRAATDAGVLSFMLSDRVDDAVSVDYVPEFLSTDTVRWRLTTNGGADGDAYDSGVLASGILPTLGIHAHLPAAGAVSAPFRKILIDFVAASRVTPPDDFSTIGRVYVGPLLKFKVNFDPKMGQRWFRDELGQHVREIQCSFERVKSDIGERATVLQMQQFATDRRQVIFIPDTAAPNEALIGKMATLDFVTGQFFNNSRLPLRLTEDWIGV